MPDVVDVYDWRGVVPVKIGTHRNVPANWTDDEVLERFGIAKHLTVHRCADGEDLQVIQYGLIGRMQS